MNTSDLVKIDCVLCGSDRHKIIYSDDPSRIVECNDCGLVFFNPQPSQNYLNAYYSSQAGYMTSIEENLRSFEANPVSWRDTANWILYKIYGHISEEKGQRLLDIGSAYGFFLIFARERGLDVRGLEISTESSKFARERGIEIWNTPLLEATVEKESFDIVTMNNVLEHTLNPMAELEKVHSLLKPPGVVYIGVPNWDSLVSRVDGFNWKMKSWPNHLYYFTSKTLGHMLAKAGFAVRETLTHMGESDYSDDTRIIRERLLLSEDRDVRQVIECLWTMGKGQELVVIAQKI
jgi:2-polyprenyl-3-methyl-5-hydroxy-6-metoxy-1,4-benzoquinol methylase/ribosomal protein S27E